MYWNSSLWASLTSLDSSDDQVLVVMIRALGTQCSYTAHSALIAFWPSGVSSPPIRTRSGSFRSRTAVPSARNSGLDSTWSDSATLETSTTAKIRELCGCDRTHLQVEAGFGVGVKYPSNALGGAHGNRTLLRDNLVAVGHFDNPPSTRLNELQVSRTTFPHPVCLCWGVHLRKECQEGFNTLAGWIDKNGVGCRAQTIFWTIIIGLSEVCLYECIYLHKYGNLIQKMKLEGV